MASNLKDYIKTLKGFKATPDEELFDRIFEEIDKPKKEKRTFLWFLLFPIIGIVAFLFIPQLNRSYDKTHVTNVVKEQDSKEISIYKSEVKSDMVIDSIKDYKKSKIVEINDSEINQTITYSNSNAPSIKKPKHYTKGIIENNTELYSIGILEARNIKQKDSKELLYNDTKSFNSKFGVGFIDNLINIRHVSDSLVAKTSQKFFTIPLLSVLENKEISITTDRQLFVGMRSKISSFRNRIPITIRVGVEESRSQFCKNGIASRIGFMTHLVLPLNKRLSLSIGMTRQVLKYDFSFDNEMLQTYGGTDKYPAMYFLRDRILTINNDMKYQTIQMGLNYYLFSVLKLKLELGFSQNLIVHSKQVISYKLQGGKTYHYQKSSIPFSLGQSRINIRTLYSLTNGIEIFAQGSFGYNFQFVGIEKEKYTGLSMGIGINIRI